MAGTSTVQKVELWIKVLSYQTDLKEVEAAGLSTSCVIFLTETTDGASHHLQ